VVAALYLVVGEFQCCVESNGLEVGDAMKYPQVFDTVILWLKHNGAEGSGHQPQIFSPISADFIVRNLLRRCFRTPVIGTV